MSYLQNTKNLITKVISGQISSVIFIDDANSRVSLLYREEQKNGQLVAVTETFRHRVLDENYESALSNLVKLHFDKKKFGKTALIISDNLFFTDTIKLPTIQKKAMSSSLGFAFNTIYSNNKDLKCLSYPLYKGKKHAIYNVIGIRKEIIEKILSALTSIGVDVIGTTFASNSSVDLAIAINGKIKNADCVLVDVKKDNTRFSLVVDGTAVAYYSLPFGYSVFSDSEIYREESLFDHSVAELLVLNAKEKAKSKKLTTYDSTEDALAMENFIKNIVGEVGTDGEETEESTSLVEYEEKESEIEAQTPSEIKGKPIKALKKIPKYMMRETPESKEGFIYENFRPIVKWSLELIRGNQEIFVTGTPKTVFVNIPKEYASVFESIKNDNQSKVNFVPLCDEDEYIKEKENLELYGGLFITKRNKVNVF